MLRGVTKLLLAMALVLLLATGLAACGGDDSSDSTTGSAPTTTQETAPATTPEDDGSAEKEKEPKDERPAARDGYGGSGTGDPGGSEESSSSAGSPDDSNSGDRADNSGASAPPATGGSASFRNPGGDNSIQNYGKEGEGAELEAASEVVVEFLDARAKGDWETACSHMAAVTLKPIEQLGARSAQLEGKGCPELVEALTGGVPASTRASKIGDGIESLRYQGARAFALWHGTDKTDYFIPLVKEDGEWKVGALAPSELP